MTNDDDIITGILQREGSAFTNDPDDAGGATRYGIDLATLRAVQPDAQVADVAALTEAQARALYETLYIARPKFDRITDDKLRVFLVDWGVNSGPGTAITHVQARVGAKADGVLGPLTIQAINNSDPRELLAALIADREAFYRAIVAHNPTEAKFLAGWLNRCRELA